MRLLAIDPGYERSALCIFENGKPVWFDLLPNEEALAQVKALQYDHLAIEMVASYGLPVGFEVFETVVWIGRMIEASGRPHTPIYRKDVKMHLCGSLRAKDSNVRQALIDRFGGKEKAVGTKKAPGPLYGARYDIWSAVAVGVTFLT